MFTHLTTNQSEVVVSEREWSREVRRALGERLKREATERGVAQRDIASALGLSQSHVSRTFSGKNKSEGIYSRVATQIGVSVEELREELESRLRHNARALSREERERVGALLVARAKAQGVTQGELAAHLGVSRNTLRRVLNGATRKRARYEEVALALRWSLAEALERADSGALNAPLVAPPRAWRVRGAALFHHDLRSRWRALRHPLRWRDVLLRRRPPLVVTPRGARHPAVISHRQNLAPPTSPRVRSESCCDEY